MASRLVRTNPVTVNDMLDGPVASVQRGFTTAGTSRTTWPSSNAHLCSRPRYDFAGTLPRPLP
jgi:hypothetical protein